MLYFCVLLFLACVVSICLLVFAFVYRKKMARKFLQQNRPDDIRFIRPALFLSLIIVCGLLLCTALYTRHTYKQYFLNEPLEAAIAYGNLAEARSLLDRGASPNACGVDFVSPAIVTAANQGHVPIVILLLERGADPNAKDLYGKSALALARKGGHSEVVTLLLKAGAKD